MIESAQYTDEARTRIRALVDGVEKHVPVDESNRDYRAILGAVDAGELTISGPEPLTLEQERDRMSATAYQTRAALNDAGLLDDVEALMTDASTPREVRLMWQYKERIRRNHPTTIDMASALGWTDKQLDDLFRAAMEIEP